MTLFLLLDSALLVAVVVGTTLIERRLGQSPRRALSIARVAGGELAVFLAATWCAALVALVATPTIATPVGIVIAVVGAVIFTAARSARSVRTIAELRRIT
jgi:hypothetical protein